MQNYLQGDLLVLDDKDGIESAQFYKKSVMWITGFFGIFFFNRSETVW
jgi:hypothetical protein